jgi:hypothetical protein
MEASKPATTRQCEECKNVLPLTLKFFPRVPGTQDALQFVCRKCKRAKLQQKKLQRIESGAIDAYISHLTKGGSNIPHTAELLESIMVYFGGSNGFASLLMKQYFESKPGSRIRNSILEMVVRLASKNTEQGGAKKPLALHTEEELEGEINKRLEQAVLTYGGKRYINAPQEETSALTFGPDSAGPVHLVIPDGRVAELAGRIEREADRSLEAIQANSQAMGVPSVPGQ